MRKATQDYGIIVDGDTFLGFALGYDYCAEHEWGIDDLRRDLGVPESSKKNMGVKSRTITKTPLLAYKEETYKKKKFAVLYMSPNSWWTEKDMETYKPRDLENYKQDILWNLEWKERHGDSNKDFEPMASAWSGRDFGVGVMGEKEIGYLRELKEAFENKNIVIAMLNLREINPFAGTSLCLMIADKLPQVYKDNMYHADKEYYDREDYEKKIGMKKILEKNRENRRNGKTHGHDHGYYIACSPKWIDYEDKERRERQKKEYGTKYDILYWVNYSDDDNTHEWCTVEEIKEWLTSKTKLSTILKRRIKEGEHV